MSFQIQQEIFRLFTTCYPPYVLNTTLRRNFLGVDSVLSAALNKRGFFGTHLTTTLYNVHKTQLKPNGNTREFFAKEVSSKLKLKNTSSDIQLKLIKHYSPCKRVNRNLWLKWQVQSNIRIECPLTEIFMYHNVIPNRNSKILINWNSNICI